MAFFGDLLPVDKALWGYSKSLLRSDKVYNLRLILVPDAVKIERQLECQNSVAIHGEPWEHAGSDLRREEAIVEYQRFITRDPKVCGGEPVIKGTRVTVRTVLASLAEGAKVEEILEDFPTLKEEEVRAVIAFAAASAEEDLPVQSVPDIR